MLYKNFRQTSQSSCLCKDDTALSTESTPATPHIEIDGVSLCVTQLQLTDESESSCNVENFAASRVVVLLTYPYRPTVKLTISTLFSGSLPKFSQLLNSHRSI